jgi:hypothetical protein
VKGVFSETITAERDYHAIVCFISVLLLLPSLSTYITNWRNEHGMFVLRG